jgi:hypothetical protein
MVVHTCNPSTLEVETGKLRIEHSKPAWATERDLVLRKIKKKNSQYSALDNPLKS